MKPLLPPNFRTSSLTLLALTLVVTVTAIPAGAAAMSGRSRLGLLPEVRTLPGASSAGHDPLTTQGVSPNASSLPSPGANTGPELLHCLPERSTDGPVADHGAVSLVSRDTARPADVQDLFVEPASFLPLVSRHFFNPPPPRVPNDALVNQWGLNKIQAPVGWRLSTGEGTVIAVLDSGIDTDHPDLAPKLWVNVGEVPDNGVDDDGNGYVDDVHGWRFDLYRGDSNNVQDDNGHGTHVAGIGGAATNNGLGVAGVGWDTRIQTLKILDSEGAGWTLDLAEAVYYAVDNGADVINLSLGLEQAQACPLSLQTAMDHAYQHGVVVVAAAGNFALGPPETFPANCKHVLGVAATDRYDFVASYTNQGNHVSVAAPGGSLGCATCEIFSTCSGNQYCYKQGTSMATPHVSGLAALIMARYPQYTPGQVASAILDNAVDLGTTGWDPAYGCGRIDAFSALAYGARGPEPLCLEGAPWASSLSNEAEIQREPAKGSFAPGEVIVALEPGFPASLVLDEYSLSADYLPRLDAWRLRVPSGEEQATIRRLAGNPAVRYAHLNHLVFAQ